MAGSSVKKLDRPTLDETYALAAGTGDLSLPQGEGVGAQGILAAAAWSEGRHGRDLGSDLRRLRLQWDNAKPRKKTPRPYELLKTGGMTRVQAKRQHNRELVQCALTYSREKKALKLRIPEYPHVLESLMIHAVWIGIEEAEARAFAVLDRWLENPNRAPESTEEAQLWQYMAECLNSAKAALRQGVQGHTNHNPA